MAMLLSDQKVYQATRDIFVGQKAKLRNIKPIRKSIDCQLRKGSLIRQLVTEYGADTIHQSALRLLSDRVYESMSVASGRFPDLFEPSAAQTAARNLLEAEATRSEHAALKGIIQTQCTDDQVALDQAEVRIVLHSKSE
jgi:hypothetical protein